MGRPTALTEVRAWRICEAVRNGHFLSAAMQNEGLNRTTYYVWIKRGERDQLAGISNIYTDFFYTIKKAEFSAEDAHLKLAQQGGYGWRSHCWFLGRRFPRRWGNQSNLTMQEAKDFMQKFLTVVGQFIPDREILQKIISDVKKKE